MKIRELAINQSAVVTGYASKDKTYRQKLLQMGLVKGVEITLVRRAPLGDPIEIKLMGFNLSLRKAEADVLELEPVPDEGWKGNSCKRRRKHGRHRP